VLSGSVSGAAVHLTTTATPRSTSYLIYRTKNSAGYFLLTTSAVSTGAALDYHDTDLADGDNVSYKVKASNAGGDSGYSNVVSQSVAVTPVDPLTLSPMIWIDGETGGYSQGT